MSTTSTPRIVSLLPSATEMVCVLGLEHALVGRSHECDFPESVAALPPCSRPRIDIDASSAVIDSSVKQLVESGLSVYDVDKPQLAALSPDIIVTQTQCEVCAVSLEDVQTAVGDWVGGQPRIVSLAPAQLADVWDDLRRLAITLDVPARGEKKSAAFEERLARLAEQTREFDTKPAVACIEWTDPLMAAGNWTPELVEIAGGRNLLGEAGRHSPPLSWESLAASEPDAIVALPCGYNLERTRHEMAPLLSHPTWPALKAVRDGRVVLTDGHQYFNRPGPRLVESAEILAESLHAGAFDFGHRGVGWAYL